LEKLFVKYSYTRRRIEVRVEKILKKLRRYTNFFLFLLTFLITYFLVKNQEYIFSFKLYGYLGGFVSGIFIPFGWVAIPAFTTLFMLGKELDTWILTFLGTMGTLTSNLYLIYWSKSISRMEFLLKIKKQLWLFTVRSKLRRIVRFNYLHNIIPALAGLIFTSPLPNQWE
jgi:hypothetical protein